ncbi:MAG: hypothetical protein HYY24_16145 [Verrucomicrobia bacterium]|nr:hypothetical protein [Verrucomicrobiota bacterium]
MSFYLSNLSEWSRNFASARPVQVPEEAWQNDDSVLNDSVGPATATKRPNVGRQNH